MNISKGTTLLNSFVEQRYSLTVRKRNFTIRFGSLAENSRTTSWKSNDWLRFAIIYFNYGIGSRRLRKAYGQRSFLCNDMAYVNCVDPKTK